MATTIESHGPNTTTAQNNISVSQDLFFQSLTGDASKGFLKITNLTTGASKQIALGGLTGGTKIWDWSVDDPTAVAGNMMEIECGGRVSVAVQQGTAPFYSNVFQCTGSGHAKASGFNVSP